MQFTFVARDTSGQEITGVIEAASKLEAADKIFNEKKLTVMKLEKFGEQISNEKLIHKTNLNWHNNETRLHIGKMETVTKSNNHAPKLHRISVGDLLNSIDSWLIDHSKITPKEKAIFFRQLAVMINAGLPIVKSLKIFVDQAENKRLKKILSLVINGVESGNNLSKMLAEYNDIFTDAEIGVIASGETSGQLNRTLSELANETEKTASLKSKIKSAMIYPIAVLSILVIVLIIVMTFVIPKLSSLFLDANVTLPFSTRVLINISNWFTGSTLLLPNYLFLLLIIFAFTIFIKIWKRTTSGKYYWDKFILSLPIFGILHIKVSLATFARQLSTLSSAGVSIIRTLEIVSNAIGNEVYRLRILESKKEVERGIPIHQTISNDKLFPGFIVSMIAVGEQTAQLASVADKVAQFYDEEVDTFITNLSKIMEPLIIVFVGTMVGLLVLAIMQPIMSISDLASQA